MARKSFALCLLVVLATCACYNVEAQSFWQYCSDRQYPIDIVQADVNPYPLLEGQPISVNFTANLGVEVPNAVANVVVKKSIVTLLKHTFNVCDYLKCTIPVGQIHFNPPAFVLPKKVPKGKYGVHVTIDFPEMRPDRELLCIKANVEIE